MESSLDVLIKKYLHIVQVIQSGLQDNLISVYVHGSLAMGGFQESISDVDLLILVSKPLEPDEKRQFIDMLMLWEARYLRGKGLEYHILLLRNVEQYPTPFELHYSAYYQERYRQDPKFLCADGVDYDLAAHLTVTYERGIPLYGPPLKQLAAPIERGYFLDSIWRDIKDARDTITSDPVYYVLNLCRVYQYVVQGNVASKKEAGAWAIHSLEADDRALVTAALREYLTGSSEYLTESGGFEWDKQQLIHFAERMLLRIEKRIEEVPITTKNGCQTQ